MSVASRNPFALLGDEDSPAVSVATPVAKTEASAPKRNVPGAGVSNGARGGGGGGAAGASGRGGARGGARGGRAAAEAGAGGDDAPAKEDRGAARGASRGRGEGRGGRARGSGRGRGRAFDRHSMTGKEDTQKNIHQGWGGDDPKRELDAEDGARADAAEEGATPAGDAAAAATAAPNGAVASSEGPEADAKLPAVEEEEKDNTKTLDEYLAELAAKRAQIGAKKETRAVEAGDLDALGQRVEKQADEDYFKTQKERTLRQREKKEKQVLEIQQSFNSPSAPRGTGRGGRGGGERGRGGGDRGSGRGRGGDRGRGAFRGAPRGGSNIRGGGASSGGANLNLTDNSAFPTLG